MPELLRFAPLYRERVWGGRVLESAFGRTLPAGATIGESWDVVDRPEAQSVVTDGAWAGQTLHAVQQFAGADVMGPDWPRGRPFPILVKWLDCRERLSLQVHPPAEVAEELRGEPKTENWFIAAAAPDSRLIVGLRHGTTRARFEQAIAEGTLEGCVHSFGVAAGDSILVRSGQVHAIDAGNLILEIQQNSDTTYRVYDWGRVGLDGRPRELHVAQSLRSIDWEDFEPAPVRAAATTAVIADCREFRIRRTVLAAGEALVLPAGEQPRLVSVAGGEVRSTADAAPAVLRAGDSALAPYAAGCELRATVPATLLVTENFCR